MRHAVARLVAGKADAIVAASEAIAEETRSLHPRSQVVTIENGCDFDDFDGLEKQASRDFHSITHAGSFFGRRDPRPFLTAFAESASMTRSPASSATSAPPTASGPRRWARRPAGAARVRASATRTRAAARLRGAAAADPRGRRPRQGRPVREGVRVPRRRAADPRGRASGRRRRRLIRETGRWSLAAPDDPEQIGERCGRCTTAGGAAPSTARR